MSRPELAILIGLQGSGKTTFAQTHLGTYDLVSKDRMRNNRNPERRQRQLITQSLEADRSAVVDNTNASADVRAPLIALGRSLGAKVVAYYFESDLKACLRRNRQRTGTGRVPDVALFATRKRLVPPGQAEGFDQRFSVRALGDQSFEVLDWKESSG